MDYRNKINIGMASLFLSALIFTAFAAIPFSVAANEGANFAGTWQTNWGPISISQIGTRVLGKYSGRFKGEIKGRVEGKRLRFKWIQPNGQWGKGYFDLSTDGSSFTGRWGQGVSNSNGGPWNGKKK